MIVAIAALAIFGTSAVQAETWTSLRGTHSVNARLIGIWNGKAVLEMDGGRRVSVRLSDLQADSRIQAQTLAKGLDKNRSDRVKQLQGNAAAAAAPAPDPLPQPPAAAPYTPPQPGADPGQFLNQVDAAMNNGHILAMYDSLPPSYRQDIDGIVQLAAQKMDPNAWRSLIGTIHQVGDLIVTRQRWLFSSPRLKALPPDQLEKIEGPLLGMAGLLRTGLDPEAMSLDTLKNTNFREWLANRDTAIAPYLAQLNQLDGETGRTFTVDSTRGTTAVVSISSGGMSQKVTFAQVDGYWVPKSLADGWAASIESTRNELTQAQDGTYMASAGMMVAPVAPVLQSLAQADSAPQFHAAIDTIMTSAQTYVMSMAPMLGGGNSLASRGGPGGGYGEDYEDMEMDMDDMYEDDMEDMEMEEEDMEEEMEEYGEQ